MDKKEVLYNMAIAIKFCESLDENTQEIDFLLNEINEENLKFKKKKNKFKGFNVVFIYLIVSLLCLIPSCVLSLFIDFSVLFFTPILGLLITILIKKYYEKNIMTQVQKTHDQMLKSLEKQLNNFIGLLYSDCEKYDFYFMDIPKELHYNIPLLFIHEAIRHDYVKTIKEGCLLYIDQLEKIRKHNSDKAKLLAQEVDNSLKVKERREELIDKYISSE